MAPIKTHKSTLSLAVRIFDSIAIGLGMLCALWWLRDSLHAAHLVEVMVAVLVFHSATAFSHSYTRFQVGANNGMLVVALIWIVSMPISAWLYQAFATAVEGLSVHGSMLELHWYPLTLFFMLAWRQSLHWVNRVVFRPSSKRKVAIVGTGELAIGIIDRLNRSTFPPVEVVGCFDDRALNEPISGSKRSGREDAQKRVAPDLYKGPIADLVQMAERGEVSAIFIALPMHAEHLIQAIVRRLQNSAASVHLCPDVSLFEIINASVVEVGDMVTINVFDNPFSGVSGWVKRLEDIVLGSLILLAVSIPMLITALAVKLTSPGPVFFRQLRYGEDGRAIKVWKFRSMRVLENSEVVKQATRNDDRVTPVGRIIRRYSIDELPQLFNVISGDMSIVGPRPHAVAHNEHYRALISGYMLRHKVKPGITGWAQVNGLRGETDTLEKMAKRVEYDLAYIQHWSVLFDLEIIMLTVIALFTDSDVY